MGFSSSTFIRVQQRSEFSVQLSSFFSLILIMNLKQRMKLLKHFGSLPSESPPPLLVVPVSGNCCSNNLDFLMFTWNFNLGLHSLMFPQHILIFSSAQNISVSVIGLLAHMSSFFFFFFTEIWKFFLEIFISSTPKPNIIQDFWVFHAAVL